MNRQLTSPPKGQPLAAKPAGMELALLRCKRYERIGRLLKALEYAEAKLADHITDIRRVRSEVARAGLALWCARLAEMPQALAPGQKPRRSKAVALAIDELRLARLRLLKFSRGDWGKPRWQWQQGLLERATAKESVRRKVEKAEIALEKKCRLR